MMDILILFFKTIALRPYVFIFLAAFLFVSITGYGRTRTLALMIPTWIIAYLSEYASTRTGFPYGWYQYTGTTRGQELFISNVPFMDSLSYTFLLFSAYSMALFSVVPFYREKGDFQLLDSFKLRQSWRVAILTALYMMMIDVVIDPVALQGDKWFLGQIYHYQEKGHYFNVPLSNAFGWGLVGLVCIRVYQMIERRWLSENFLDKGISRFRLHGLLGIGLYYGVLFFNMGVTAYIREWGLFIADTFIYLIPSVLLVMRCLDPHLKVTQALWLEHLQKLMPHKSA